MNYTGEFVVPDKTPYETWQEHIARYIFASAYVKGKKGLDIACGSGYGASYLKRKGAKEVLGGDISKEALRFTSTSYKQDGLSFVRLDAASLPFPANYFDVIVSFETIEHLKDYEGFLRECKRVLRNGGIFVCSVPNRKVYLLPWIKSNPFHFQEFRVDEFRKLVAEHFGEIALFAHNILSLRDRIRYQISNNSIPRWLSSFLARKHIKLRILPSSRRIARLGLEISDISLDARYKVIPFQDGFCDSATHLIAVAKKV